MLLIDVAHDMIDRHLIERAAGHRLERVTDRIETETRPMQFELVEQFAELLRHWVRAAFPWPTVSPYLVMNTSPAFSGDFGVRPLVDGFVDRCDCLRPQWAASLYRRLGPRVVHPAAFESIADIGNVPQS